MNKEVLNQALTELSTHLCSGCIIIKRRNRFLQYATILIGLFCLLPSAFASSPDDYFSWMQYGFAGFCAFILMGTFHFINTTFGHLRKLELDRCAKHTEALEKLTAIIMTTTETNKLFQQHVILSHDTLINEIKRWSPKL